MGGCTICGELPARVDADLEAGESLPAAASTLSAIADGNARRCPECGAFFLYTYDYEYGAMGDGWETARLERIDREPVIALLLESTPGTAVVAALAELGVSDAAAIGEQRLIADLDAAATSHDAVVKLVSVFRERSDVPAIVALLHHARPEVRSQVLYTLQQPGPGSWFAAARAASDPSPEVRARAVAAAVASAIPASDPITQAVIECLEDPVADVRSNAAWTLAVYAEGKRDIAAALPALRRLVTSDPSDKVRTTAKRALVGAGVKLADSKPTERERYVSRQVIGAHREFPLEPAFSPDGSRFLTGDRDGWLVIRTRRADDPTMFEETAQLRTPSPGHGRPQVHSVAWPTNDLVVSTEWGALRVRRASDLQEVAIAENVGQLVAAGGGGTWLGILSQGTVSVREMPALKFRSISAFQRGDFQSFSVGPLAVDPRGSLFAVADDGGSDETAMAMITRTGESQVTIVDVARKKPTTVAVIEQGVGVRALAFDAWRSRIVTVTYAGEVGLWSHDGTLQQRFRPYDGATLDALVVTERWLLTMDDRAIRVDLWDPVSLARAGSITLPKDTRRQWLCASPDGTTLLTFEYVPGGTFAIRIWAIEPE